METYRDKYGIAFADYRELLPKRVADWPRIKRISNPNLGRQMHFIWDHCIVCGRKRGWINDWLVRLEMHHLFAGSAGRSDELCSVAMLCSEHGIPEGCHQRYGPRSDANISLLLWAKWRVDPCNTDWKRMALLAGRFLPEPMPDARLLAEYLERTGQRKSWEA